MRRAQYRAGRSPSHLLSSLNRRRNSSYRRSIRLAGKALHVGEFGVSRAHRAGAAIFNQLGERRRPGSSIEVAVGDMLVLVNEGESQVVV